MGACIGHNHQDLPDCFQFVVVGGSYAGKTTLIRLIQLSFHAIEHATRANMLTDLTKRCVYNQAIVLLERVLDRVAGVDMASEFRDSVLSVCDVLSMNDNLNADCVDAVTELCNSVKWYDNLEHVRDLLVEIRSAFVRMIEPQYVATNHDLLKYQFPSVGTFVVGVDDKERHYDFVDVSSNACVSQKRWPSWPLKEEHEYRVILTIGLDTLVCGPHEFRDLRDDYDDDEREVYDSQTSFVTQSYEFVSTVYAQQSGPGSAPSSPPQSPVSASRTLQQPCVTTLAIALTKYDVFENRVKSNAQEALKVFRTKFPKYEGPCDASKLIQHVQTVFEQELMDRHHIVWIVENLLECQAQRVVFAVREMSRDHPEVSLESTKTTTH